MSRTSGADQLAHALAQFRGKTMDEIAEIVKRRRIKGRMGTTYGCPMALLLDGFAQGVYIVGRRYIVRRSGSTIDKTRTPAPVAAFMRKFDIGGYPELVAPPPRCVAQAPKSKDPRKGDRHLARKPRNVKNQISKLVARFA